MAATIMMIMMPVIMIRVLIIMIIMIMRAGQPEDPGACSVARARDQAPPQRPSHRHRGRDSESRHGGDSDMPHLRPGWPAPSRWHLVCTLGRPAA